MLIKCTNVGVCIPIFLILLFCGTEQIRANPDDTIPKDFMEYIRDASRLGLKPEQIQENAVKAGWPVASVKQGLAKMTVQAAPEPASPSQPSPSNPKIPAPQTAQAATAEASDKGNVPANPNVPDDYRIGAGDVLQVSVWKEPEASIGGVVVRPDGKIGLPLLKDIEVIGLTPHEAEKLITQRLEKFIPAADVTVVVKDINSKKIYIVGAVKKEGPIPYAYRMTIMQAISEAGGLSDYAKRKKIYVLRSQNGKDYRLPFDYDAVLKGERMELNVPLLPGDTLIVPH